MVFFNAQPCLVVDTLEHYWLQTHGNATNGRHSQSELRNQQKTVLFRIFSLVRLFAGVPRHVLVLPHVHDLSLHGEHEQHNEVQKQNGPKHWRHKREREREFWVGVGVGVRVLETRRIRRQEEINTWNIKKLEKSHAERDERGSWRRIPAGRIIGLGWEWGYG